MKEPPYAAIEAAIGAGCASPCAKSKRGAAVYSRHDDPICIYGIGFNSQPPPFACSGDARCREACGKLCAHAEQRALRDALSLGRWPNRGHLGGVAPRPNMAGFELVHAKVIDGQLVAGGGPSCIACSVAVLDVGLDGVWLYQTIDPHLTPGEWHYYRAADFHAATLKACGMEAAP